LRACPFGGAHNFFGRAIKHSMIERFKPDANILTVYHFLIPNLYW